MEKSAYKLNVNNVKMFTLKPEALKKELSPLKQDKNAYKVVYFPDAEGNYISFRVQEKSILPDKLALKYPGIKSYSGYGLEDKSTKIRFSVSHKGIQSMIIQKDKSTFMQKAVEDSEKYVVYTRDSGLNSKNDFLCETKAEIQNSMQGKAFKLVDDQILR